MSLFLFFSFFYTVSSKFIISWRQILARDRISFLLFGNPVFVKARQNESRWLPALPYSLQLRRRNHSGCYSCRGQWDTWDIIQFWHEHFMPTSNGLSSASISYTTAISYPVPNNGNIFYDIARFYCSSKLVHETFLVSVWYTLSVGYIVDFKSIYT